MEMFIDFVKSDLGVTLSWICTIVSTIFALCTVRKNKQLELTINTMTNNSNIDNSQNSVTQNGEKNIYTEKNSGGIKINM
nr:hypothetical protein C0W80_08955 [Photobacterium leiognathi subsp. mandapamensis]